MHKWPITRPFTCSMAMGKTMMVAALATKSLGRHVGSTTARRVAGGRRRCAPLAGPSPRAMASWADDGSTPRHQLPHVTSATTIAASRKIDWGDERWMKDPTHPRLQEFLEREQRYLRATLAKPRFRHMERVFYGEFRQRLPREDETVPERIGAFEYSMRQRPGDNFPIYFRRHVATGREETVLNQNANPMLHQDYHFITAMKISPDERRMLIVQENAHEEYRVLLHDFGMGRLEILDALKCVRNVEWACHETFYFTQVDHHRRPFIVSRYDLTTRSVERVYEEADEAHFLDVSSTKDNQFVLINSNSKDGSEIRAIPCVSDRGGTSPRPILLRPREPGTSYFADHVRDRFFIVTNSDRAENYKIIHHAPPHLNWETLLPESPHIKIDDVDLFESFLVIYERVQSVPRIRICPLDGDPIKDAFFVPLPSQHEICRITPGVNRESSATCVRFSISTPLVPEIVYDFDFKKRKLMTLKETTVIGLQAKVKTNRPTQMRREKALKSLLNPDEFECRRAFVPSHDGVEVPLTLIHRRDLKNDGQNPTLLMGYGAYGTNMEADFDLETLSLLERGWIIAKAHVRGGGELGLQWYRDGRQLRKMNTFHDFLSCTRYVLDQHLTTPARLAGKGVSAGGLIMGYMANQHPDLFRAMILKVPFVDILETMQDNTLPLTVHEYDEWGNPANPSVHEYIQQFSPCTNIVPGQRYPSMLVTGSMNDIRVQFWEPVKWIHRLRRLQAGKHSGNSNESAHVKPQFLLKMSEDDGHFGGGGRLEQLQETAMEYAFLYHALRLPFPGRDD